MKNHCFNLNLNHIFISYLFIIIRGTIILLKCCLFTPSTISLYRFPLWHYKHAETQPNKKVTLLGVEGGGGGRKFTPSGFRCFFVLYIFFAKIGSNSNFLSYTYTQPIQLKEFQNLDFSSVDNHLKLTEI